MRGYWLGWRKGKSAFTADALAGTRERAREGQERDREEGMSLPQSFYLTFIGDESRQTRGTCFIQDSVLYEKRTTGLILATMQSEALFSSLNKIKVGTEMHKSMGHPFR